MRFACPPATVARYRPLRRSALAYLATRDNAVHTRIAVELAWRLKAREGGEELAIVPAVILHDVGWHRVPAALHPLAFGPRATRPDPNRRHELEGVQIARRRLQRLPLDGRRRQLTPAAGPGRPASVSPTGDRPAGRCSPARRRRSRGR